MADTAYGVAVQLADLLNDLERDGYMVEIDTSQIKIVCPATYDDPDGASSVYSRGVKVRRMTKDIRGTSSVLATSDHKTLIVRWDVTHNA